MPTSRPVRRRVHVGYALLTAVLAAAALSWGGGSAAADDSAQVMPKKVTGPLTIQRPVATVTNTTGVAGVVAYDTAGYPAAGTAGTGTLEHQHAQGPVRYRVQPPVGGPHSAHWVNAGVYTKPVPSERAVHDLEHGAVWITYEPGLPQAQLDRLVAFVDRQSMLAEGNRGPGGTPQANRFVLLSPWPDDTPEAPIVVTSWGYQLKLTSATDPRLQQFVDTFRRNATYSPEADAPVDSVSIAVGGRPARDGSKQPNPA
ncbi:Protein of unknown function [Jatrophihabitans endophyticus]|uniref:DUF3105 domain-containing protein n=1 Tax=Jatrophihabitans endophyticus TaxID=1206085 RepID=A0A1M5SSV3_9ACTN|nr:Protein of unknown function [Jatrophihabitans endophyticus]